MSICERHEISDRVAVISRAFMSEVFVHDMIRSHPESFKLAQSIQRGFDELHKETNSHFKGDQ